MFRQRGGLVEWSGRNCGHVHFLQAPALIAGPLDLLGAFFASAFLGAAFPESVLFVALAMTFTPLDWCWCG